MKRVISLILMVCVCLGVVLFSSCNGDKAEGTHQHEYANEWSTDDTAHWKICSGDGCKSRTEYAEHTYKENYSDPESPKNQCTVCGYIEKVAEHNHNFEKKYVSVNGYHWHRCTKPGCGEMLEKEPHAYGNPEIIQETNRIIKTLQCVDCKYKTVEIYDISSVIKDADAWNEAFLNLDLTNYSANVIKVKNDNSERNENYVAVSDNGAYYCDNNGGLEYYTVKADDGFATYRRIKSSVGTNQSFTKLSDNSDVNYRGAKNATFMHVSFENNFDLFTYVPENGEYVCEDDISAVIYNFDGSVDDRRIFCNNITVKITDGNVTYISMNYYFDQEGKELYTRTLTYYNIGMTNVTLAKEIVENAVAEK